MNVRNGAKFRVDVVAYVDVMVKIQERVIFNLPALRGSTLGDQFVIISCKLIPFVCIEHANMIFWLSNTSGIL